MASRGYLAKQEIGAKKQLQEEDHRFKEKEAKKDRAVDIITSVIGAGGRVGSSALKGGSSGKTTTKYLFQDPDWYSKWLNFKDFGFLSSYRNEINALIQQIRVLTSAYSNNPTVISTRGNKPYVLGIRYMARLGTFRNTAAGYQIQHPVNTAFMKDLSAIAAVNSRAVNQDPDVMGLYVLGAAEVAAALAKLKSGIEIAQTFNSEQSKLRDALLDAKGFQPGLFVSNLAEYIKLYRMYSKRFNEEIVLPGDLSLIKRRVWCESVILTDHDTSKPQYVVFHRFAFGTVSASADAIDFDITDTFQYLQWDNWFATAFARLTEDVDFQTLVGNMRAALKGSYVKLPEDYTEHMITSNVDKNAMLQFHNIRTLPYNIYKSVGATAMLAFNKISSDGTNLYQPTSFNAPIDATDIIRSDEAAATILDEVQGHDTIDFYHDDVSSDDYMEATRLHPIYRVSCTGTSTGGSSGDIEMWQSMSVSITTEGTELPLYCEAKWYDTSVNAFVDTVVASYLIASNLNVSTFNEQMNMFTYTMDALRCAIDFDWLFKLTIVSNDTDAKTTRRIRINRVYESYRTVELSFEMFSRLNEVALKSLAFTSVESFKK